MIRLVVANMAGGKAESATLHFSGSSATRALILVNDCLARNKKVDALLCVGMSAVQMREVDISMFNRGYLKVIHPEFLYEKEPFRFSCVTVAYIRQELKPRRIIYEDDKLSTKYRYAAFRLPGDIEVRVMHIPAVAQMKGKPKKQIERKRSMLSWEAMLEKEEIARGASVICCGDFNTEEGNLEAHDIFDALPYRKLLNEATWKGSRLDNVLVSPTLEGRAAAYTSDYRLNITTDHKIVVIDVKTDQ